jgi:GTP diphosphokinase / guanosine-3',5'-bis(diphosphate) 3'-diphosphatase
LSTLERAIEIAAQVHAGRVDKGKSPYILHPLRVMLAVEDSVERIAAVLHDVVEDSDWTLSALEKEGFSPEVIRAVEALTHREGESYVDYVERAGKNPVARRVKIADLTDNMNLSRIAKPTKRDIARIRKYESALASLGVAVQEPAPTQ